MQNLAIFDFDHTILDDNSDTAILELVDKNEIPQEIKNIQFTDGWTAFMQAIFTYMYEKGVTVEQILSHVQSLQPVGGMVDLIRNLKMKLNYDLVVVSDSNSVFIKTWLEKHKLETCFTEIFTNPTKIVGGMFQISPYDDQDVCKLSTRNLCKGKVLDEFIKSQQENGIFYNKLVYVGDGSNDFCPILRLKENDLACVRNNYKLLDLVQKAKRGKYVDNAGKPYMIKSLVCIWNTADDIADFLLSKN
ncbi:pyridoxal phosphate phosphatase PHOSPHO2-like [Zophobas morio]